MLFFGGLRDMTGRSAEELSLPPGSTVADLLRHYMAQVPAFGSYAQAIAVSRNQEYVTRNVALADSDEIALLPPVSGGSSADAAAGETGVRLVREKIDSAAIIDALKQPQDGAVVVFEGIVRNNSRGRPTLYLDYDAYEGMALRQLESLLAQAREKFSISDARIVHRLGRLQIGETSVLIVVASAHRAAAFEACRWLIDTLKRTVPIWKKEYFADGAVWADGEPFPDEIRAPKVAGSHTGASK